MTIFQKYFVIYGTWFILILCAYSYFVWKSVYETTHSVKNVMKFNLKIINHEKVPRKMNVTSNERKYKNSAPI